MNIIWQFFPNGPRYIIIVPKTLIILYDNYEYYDNYPKINVFLHKRKVLGDSIFLYSRITTMHYSIIHTTISRRPVYNNRPVFLQKTQINRKNLNTFMLGYDAQELLIFQNTSFSMTLLMHCNGPLCHSPAIKKNTEWNIRIGENKGESNFGVTIRMWLTWQI